MEILSAKDLSKYLKINEKKIYQLVRESKLPYTKIGGKITFAREIIDAWITENTERERHLYIAGSDDVLFRRIIDVHNGKGGSTIFYAPVGSMNGLKLLRRKAANASCVHILDVEKKEYNLSYIDRYLSSKNYVVIHLYLRKQGLYLEKNNPKKVHAIEDLAAKGVTFVNRNQGSGTRLLFDFLLHERGVEPGRVKGYSDEVESHLRAGLKVLRGEADASFGIRYVADLLGLYFVQLFEEQFDMVIPEEHFHSEQVNDFLGFFDQGRLLQYVKDFTGYDTTKAGSVIYPH